MPDPAHPLKLLFVCSRNRRRSLTAERLFDGSQHAIARSAGTQPTARVALTAGLIGWADVVFFMERSHLNRARLKFAEELDATESIVLRIPDDFEFMDEDLILLLKQQLALHNIVLP
jgi:predicted protein tyrosine phosphatase